MTGRVNSVAGCHAPLSNCARRGLITEGTTVSIVFVNVRLIMYEVLCLSCYLMTFYLDLDVTVDAGKCMVMNCDFLSQFII